MNKKKFEKKVKELYAYEDEMLAKMNEIIKPYNEELNKQGCEIVCKLNWESEMQSDDEFMLTERPKIIKHKGYRCLMIMQFSEIGSVYDSDGYCEKGFELYNDVTFYGLIMFTRAWHFKKNKMKWMFDSVDKCYNLIKEKGLEQAKKEAFITCKVRCINN